MKSSCFRCGSSLEGWEAAHLCGKCGFPQPVSKRSDFFSAFGVPRRFRQDLADLERRYYRVSRLIHPDRFSQVSPEAKELSLGRMSFLNLAYETLKNPWELRSYLLQLQGAKSPDQKATIPLELSEAWFEVQDLLSEDTQKGLERLMELEKTIERLKAEASERFAALENEYDRTEEEFLRGQILERIADEVQKKSYLDSMEKDIERVRKNAS